MLVIQQQTFNPSTGSRLYLDINSCFAAIEQLYQPRLRGLPVVVGAYTSPKGCILASSVEAKALGVKTGMRIGDARRICPGLCVLPSDPPKYRQVHQRLWEILKDFSPAVFPKSIDEFIVDMDQSPYPPYPTALKIKARIAREIGPSLTVSIGLAPNTYLAKLASDLQKPDGLVEIRKENWEKVLRSLSLTDLPWVKTGLQNRLNQVGIFNALSFYHARPETLKAALGPNNGWYWFLQLRGWEIGNVVQNQKSFGQSFSLPKALSSWDEVGPLVFKLTEKMSRRLRQAGLCAGQIALGCLYVNRRFWYQTLKLPFQVKSVFEFLPFFARLFRGSPQTPLHTLSVSCSGLQDDASCQLELFGQAQRRKRLWKAVDALNERFGIGCVVGGSSLKINPFWIKDRIAFGQFQGENTPVCPRF